MQVPHVLLVILEDLCDDDFQKFKWYLLTILLDDCKPIPKSHLEKASRTETVSRLMEHYGVESAVRVTAEVLKKMGLKDAEEKLKKMYEGTVSGGKPSATATTSSASAPIAAPATVFAQQGGMVFAPMVTGGSSGSWNITINKP